MTFDSTDFGYMLTLEPGEELVRCIIQFAREQELESAALSGGGTVTELELGAGSRDRDQGRRRVHEPLDACSFTGTVTLVDGEPFPELRGTFARGDNTVLGGQVYQAVCAARIDIAIHTADPHVGRSGSSPHFDTFSRDTT